MKRFVLFISVFIAIAAIWSGAWIFVSTKISQQVALLGQTGNPQLPSITCERFDVGGFPFAIVATCQDATIIDGDMNFSLAGVSATYSVFSPTSAKITGTSPLKYSNAFFASEQELRWQRLGVEIQLDGWQLKRTSLRAADINYVDLLIGEELVAGATSFEAHLMGGEKNAAAANQLMSADILVITDGFNFTNANILEGRALMEATISNLPSDIRQWADPEIVLNWRKNRGQLFLTRLDGDDKNTEFSVSGQAELDARGYLDGDIIISSKGIVELIAPNFSPDIQPLIFGDRQNDGSFEQNVSFKDGTIYSGLLPVGQLPAFL